MDGVCSDSTKFVNVGRWPSEPLDTLIGVVLANQRGVWEGGILCAPLNSMVCIAFLCTLFRYFLFSCFGLLARD